MVNSMKNMVEQRTHLVEQETELGEDVLTEEADHEQFQAMERDTYEDAICLA
jgi:hypothetical protein